jgi:hypothetical protein
MTDAPKRFSHYLASGGLSKPVRLGGEMRAAGKALHAGEGPFVTLRGQSRKSDLKRRLALRTVRKMLSAGAKDVRVHNAKGKLIYHVKRAAPPVINIDGNAKVDAVWTYEKTHYPNVSFLGAYVCKFIAGTSTHSQHAYGNAVDCGGVSMDELNNIANDLIAHAVELSLENVIVADRIWTRGQGTRAYTGEYHFHVHADCFPSIDPSLPCGVRG